MCVILDKEPIIGQGTFTSLQRLVVSGSCRDFCLSMVSPHATFPAPRLYNYKLFLGCFQFHSLFPRSRRRSQQVIELMHGLKTASEFTVLLPFVCNCSHIKIFIYCTYSIYIYNWLFPGTCAGSITNIRGHTSTLAKDGSESISDFMKRSSQETFAALPVKQRCNAFSITHHGSSETKTKWQKKHFAKWVALKIQHGISHRPG